MITTVNTCCIIHGKVCCNANIATNDAMAAFCCINLLQHESVLQQFNATVSCNTSAPLQHQCTVAMICCNTGLLLQRSVATQVPPLQHKCHRCNTSVSLQSVSAKFSYCNTVQCSSHWHIYLYDYNNNNLWHTSNNSISGEGDDRRCLQQKKSSASFPFPVITLVETFLQ